MPEFEDADIQPVADDALPNTNNDPIPSDERNSTVKLFGRQPALAIAIITSAILLAGTFGFHWLSGEQAGLWVAAISAAGAAATALVTRPVAPSAFAGLIGALVAVATAYGLTLSPETVAAINSFVVSLLAFLVYGQVSPISTPVTKASTNPTPEAVAAETGAITDEIEPEPGDGTTPAGSLG